MKTIGAIITPALTILLVGLILPMVLSADKKSAKTAEKEHCICYGSAIMFTVKLFAVALMLVTSVTIVCTILSIIDPQMMGVSSEDIGGIAFLWILCIVFDIAVTLVFMFFKRKIYYDDVSFTEYSPFGKPKKYLFSDITGIINDTKIVIYSYRSPTRRKGKLKIYFGNECVKISGLMHGISPFIEVLHEKCKRIKFN